MIIFFPLPMSDCHSKKTIVFPQNTQTHNIDLQSQDIHLIER